jgi:hypothetical protein
LHSLVGRYFTEMRKSRLADPRLTNDRHQLQPIFLDEVLARTQESALHEQVATATMRALRGERTCERCCFEHTELNRATVFIDVLRSRGVETVVIELDRGDELADWRHFDIVLAMGGPQSAFEESVLPMAC